MKGLTKSGEPRMGARFSILCDDGERRLAKVVGKGHGPRGPGAHGCVMVIVEWEDEEGGRDTASWPALLDRLEEVG